MDGRFLIRCTCRDAALQQGMLATSQRFARHVCFSSAKHSFCSNRKRSWESHYFFLMNKPTTGFIHWSNSTHTVMLLPCPCMPTVLIKSISICGKIQASTMVKFLNKRAVMNINCTHMTIKRITLQNFATKLWTQLCSVIASSRGGGQNLSTDISMTSLFIFFFLCISLLHLFWYAFSPVSLAAFFH